MSVRLYVGNLPTAFDAKELEALFASVGEGVRFKAVNDRDTGACRGPQGRQQGGARRQRRQRSPRPPLGWRTGQAQVAAGQPDRRGLSSGLNHSLRESQALPAPTLVPDQVWSWQGFAVTYSHAPGLTPEAPELVNPILLTWLAA